MISDKSVSYQAAQAQRSCSNGQASRVIGFNIEVYPTDHEILGRKLDRIEAKLDKLLELLGK